MTKDSPEFSPSILQNKRGPLRPQQGSTKTARSLLPQRLDLFLADKRVLALFCLFLPPLAVFLQTGLSRKFGLSLLLFAFFIVPGNSIIVNFYRDLFQFIIRNFVRILCDVFGIGFDQ